jgi:hypothetical protein
MMPTGPSTAELNEARADARAYQRQAEAYRQSHISDLLELADRRVRLISRLTIPALIAIGTLGLFVRQPLLELLSRGSAASAQILYPMSVVALSVAAVWLQQRRHKLVATPFLPGHEEPTSGYGRVAAEGEKGLDHPGHAEPARNQAVVSWPGARCSCDLRLSRNSCRRVAVDASGPVPD